MAAFVSPFFLIGLCPAVTGAFLGTTPAASLLFLAHASVAAGRRPLTEVRHRGLDCSSLMPRLPPGGGHSQKCDTEGSIVPHISFSTLI